MLNGTSAQYRPFGAMRILKNITYVGVSGLVVRVSNS